MCPHATIDSSVLFTVQSILVGNGNDETRSLMSDMSLRRSTRSAWDYRTTHETEIISHGVSSIELTPLTNDRSVKERELPCHSATILLEAVGAFSKYVLESPNFRHLERTNAGSVTFSSGLLNLRRLHTNVRLTQRRMRMEGLSNYRYWSSRVDRSPLN